MLVWRGALAAGIGCGIVYLAVASASTPAIYVGPPVTAAVLLTATGLLGSRMRPRRLRRSTPARSVTAGIPDGRSVLEERAAEVARAGETMALLSLRLDGVGDVADALGSTAWHKLVVEVGTRVAACLRTGDTAVRLADDEFAVLLPEAGHDRASAVAEQILHRLREPIDVAGMSIVATVSVGVAADATDLDALVRAANLARHQATNEGGDRIRAYSPRLLHEVQQRINIESELRDAVADGHLCVYFQPIVETESGRARSVEALVRWNHPRLGLLTPPQFLDLAERAGLMVDIGRHVLELACAQLVDWRRQWPELAVAVNVAEQELVHPGYAAGVFATLSRFGLPPSALHLEVTETVAVGEDTITAALEPLAAAGVACSLDDFGTGHSSLHRLRRLPVQRLKIDKSFVAALSNEQRGAPLLASIIAMAHAVGHIVVAEGVETSEEAAFLAEHGCDELQGYLFSRPVPAAQVAGLLSRTPMAAPVGTVAHVAGCR